MLHRASVFNRFPNVNSVAENGHEIWNKKHYKSLYGRLMKLVVRE
jgi:hypothetical protein